MQDSADDTASTHPAGSEDVVGSGPTRLDALVTRVSLRLPQSFGRATVLTLMVLMMLLGLVIGTQLPGASGRTEPVALSILPENTETIAGPGSADDGRGSGLLTLDELTAIGEPASGGTYTRGSSSAIPDPCSRPDPGDTGVSYVPGPSGATAVSFRVTGGSVTERVTTLLDDAAARAEMQALLGRVRSCAVGSGVNVELATIGPGVGDEYVQAMVTRSYPSGSSSTVAILLVRMDRSLLEFSLTGPSITADDSSRRCLAIARAALSR